MSYKLATASVGDIHLGHSHTPTLNILKGLRAAFPDTEETGLLDLIFIEGDVFDHQLSLPDPLIAEIMHWIHSFLRMCARRNISVRVLEGTPSHDWKQSWMFNHVAFMGQIPVDLVYVSDVRIEEHPLGCTILYVPDEWRPDNDQTYLEVRQAMADKGLEQVDFACMHGTFPHQLPPHVRSPIHDSERYLRLVKHVIYVGHIHTSSIYSLPEYPSVILAAGSFDRLSHGQEEPKGHFRVTMDTNGDRKIVFIENKLAQIYKTIDCTGLPLDAGFAKIQAQERLPEGSYLRIQADPENPLLVNMELVRKRYPQFTFSTLVERGSSVQPNLLVDLRAQYKQINITAASLPVLMRERLEARNHPPELIERTLRLLQPAL